MRFWTAGGATRIAIEADGEFRFKSDRLPNPDRVFFDLEGASPEMFRKGMHVIAVGGKLLKQIRVAETQPGVTRIVLDLESPVECVASQLVNPNRLMIELRPAAQTAHDSESFSVVHSVTGVQRLTGAGVRRVDADLLAPASAIIDAAPVRMDATRVAATVPPPMPAVSRAPRIFQPPAMSRRRAPSMEPVRIADPPRLGAASRSSAPSNLFDTAHPAPPPASEGEIAEVTDLIRLADTSRMAETAAPSPPRRDREPGLTPLPAKRNTGGDRSLTRVLGLKLGRVVLDPGHGGNDAGTNGPGGLLEKDLVLDVTKRLGALIEQRLGSEVIYTRTDDTFIPLEERTRIANREKADLFLSIHANSSPYRGVSGVETYYLNFTESKTALDVAARENASSELSIYDLKDLLQKIALKDKIEESREFASDIQASLYSLSAHGSAA
ncbi:MAG: N-acetylmuramoyl-L-alanine amidase, partial [Bryobacteraceae bacterium]